jgi:SOS-response transcriptional repressor LexA
MLSALADDARQFGGAIESFENLVNCSHAGDNTKCIFYSQHKMYCRFVQLCGMEQKDRLKLVRENAGFKTPTDAARAHRWTATTYISHENGTRPLSRKAAVKYGSAFRASAGWLLYGENGGDAAPEPILVPVRGNTACGVWAENGRFQDQEYPPIPVVPTKYKGTEQFAFRVIGMCMDKLRIFDGDFVVCVPFWVARSNPVEGDVVVIERRRGQVTERTCKQVTIVDGRIEFWPRSLDPEFQPVIIPDQNEPFDESGAVVEIVGLVIGRYAAIG